MTYIKYSGKVSPYISFLYQGASVDGSLADDNTKNYPYNLRNDSIYQFIIRIKIGKKTYLFKRIPTKKNKYYNSYVHIYYLPPIDTKILSNFLINHKDAQCKINFKYKYMPFFYYLLQCMTSTDFPLYNLANPDPNIKKKFEKSYKLKKGKKGQAKYNTLKEKIENVPLSLSHFIVEPNEEKKAPLIFLTFNIDIMEKIKNKNKQKNMICKLVSMDYPKLIKEMKILYKENRNKKNIEYPNVVDLWYDNILNYLINYTNIKHGEDIRKYIVNKYKSNNEYYIAKHLRDEIDDWLITANHWGARRERKIGEKHQRDLSDIFGTIQHSCGRASPVNFLKHIRKKFDLKFDDYIPLILQYGVGHCGEHAHVSFAILRDIARTPGSSVKYIVYTGNSNVDHDFVIFGLDVKKIVETYVQSNRNTRFTEEEPPHKTMIGHGPIYVWNLRETIDENKGRKGFVMDPYLDPSALGTNPKFPVFVEKLRAILNGKGKKKKNKDTDFLIFGGSYPRGNPRNYEDDGNVIKANSVKNV